LNAGIKIRGQLILAESEQGQPFIIRGQTRGDAGKALQAAGVALGPAVRTQDNSTRA